MQTNKRFETCRVGQNNFIIRRDSDSQALRRCLNNPEQYLNSGSIVKNSRTTKAALTKLDDGTGIFIKRYNNKGFVYSLKYLPRMARAFRAWRSAWTLEACGLSTPGNIAAASIRSFGILKSAYLITEVVDNCVDVLDFYKIIQSNNSLRAKYIEAIVRDIATLHENRITHGDLKLSNIFIKDCGSGEYEFGLWDLDGTQHFSKPLSIEKRNAEMARVIASYIELGLRIDITHNQADIENLFLKIYAKHTNIDLQSAELSAMISKYVTKSHKRIVAARSR